MKRYKAVVVPKDDADGPTEDNSALLKMELTFTVGDEFANRTFGNLPSGVIPGTMAARWMRTLGYELGSYEVPDQRRPRGWRVESMDEITPKGNVIRREGDMPDAAVVPSHTGMHSHSDLVVHSHEVRPDHGGVQRQCMVQIGDSFCGQPEGHWPKTLHSD